jgi:hypothetical protein
MKPGIARTDSLLRDSIAFRIAAAAIVLAYHFFFAGRALHGRFAPDDMMNIHYYWSQGGWALVRGLVEFFSTYQRPVGGVFYWVLYRLFGLNPFPYHVVISCLLVANLYLAYRLAVLISGSETIGWCCAFFLAYRVELAHLVFLPSFVFDVLCFTFYLLALVYYLRIRRSDRPLLSRELAFFLLLYIAALGSKEMAITLPAVILLWEVLCCRPVHLLPALSAGAVTAVCILGKTLGPGSLVAMEGYRPLFTWARYLESMARFLTTFFAQAGDGAVVRPALVLPVLALLLAIAWRLKDRYMIWLWCFLVVTPLPIAFLPGRGFALLVIPFAGWALYLSTLFVRLCAKAPPAVEIVLILAGAVAVAQGTARQNARVMPAMEQVGQLTSSVIEQVRAVQPRVRPRSRIYFVNDVFEAWDTKFIAELTYGDPTVDVVLGNQTPLAPADVAKMDYVFAFESGRLKRLKPPPSAN